MSHSDRFGPELHPLVNEESTNSESRDSSDEIQWWVGELLVSSKEIGKSGKGTVVYKGSYKDEEVAVKRVLKSHLVDDNEIEILEKCGYHPNIASYKGHESDRDFRYLILEPCLCNLYDLIQICPAPNQHKPDLHRSMSSVTDRLEKLKVILGDFKIYNEITDCPSRLLLKLMRDMVSGLDHLHKLGIIHRDLKPENILITMEGPTLCVKLSDMDISRCLAEDKSSLSNHNTGSGTMGWTAPEKLLSRRQTCKMDMFSLGCVLFFCFTGGEHPYGDHDERNGNIKKDNKKNMYMIQDFPEVFHLISALLDYDPEKRPTAIDVLNDPMFGDADKKTSEDGGDQERKTLKGASSLAKASGSAKVSQQLDFVESGKSSICRGSTSSDTNDESTCSGSGMMGDKQKMHIMQNFPEAFHLISALLEADSKKRPKAIEAWNHPLFWDAKKRLLFLRDTSDRVRENHDLFKALKCTARSVLGTKSEGKEIQAWDKNMDDKIISHMSQSMTKSYNFYSVQDLLRLIRNMLIHYTLLPKDIQILWGHLYERIDDYLRSRFPKLLTEVYKVVCEYCKEEDYFRRYFS